MKRMSESNEGPGGNGAQYVCPFCGSTFEYHRIRCSNCQSNPVVAIDDEEVYERIHLMCGPSASINDTPDGKEIGGSHPIIEWFRSRCPK